MTDYKAIKLMRNGCEYCFPWGWGWVYPTVDALIVGWWGSWWTSYSCVAWWGWAWWVIARTCLVVWSPETCVVVWAWWIRPTSTTANWQNWWNSCFWCCVAYWGWGWWVAKWNNWWSWWWSTYCDSSQQCAKNRALGCVWQWSIWWVSTYHRIWWSWWGASWEWRIVYYNYCNTPFARCSFWPAWWPWIISSIDWTSKCYAWGGWWWTVDAECYRQLWNYWWWNWWSSGMWSNATTCWSWGWWWAYPWYCWWNGACWIVVVRYKTDGSCWITCATWWCVYTCGDYTIHCFTSNWTFTIVS